ncbi:unnamed protein product [Amoebophrya sp. A25]|nr:unnamed protein product [Amoebophrya sp. A25]|eukprot:GSA25T00020763001.1
MSLLATRDVEAAEEADIGGGSSSSSGDTGRISEDEDELQLQDLQTIREVVVKNEATTTSSTTTSSSTTLKSRESEDPGRLCSASARMEKLAQEEENRAKMKKAKKGKKKEESNREDALLTCVTSSDEDVANGMSVDQNTSPSGASSSINLLPKSDRFKDAGATPRRKSTLRTFSEEEDDDIPHRRASVSSEDDADEDDDIPPRQVVEDTTSGEDHADEHVDDTSPARTRDRNRSADDDIFYDHDRSPANPSRNINSNSSSASSSSTTRNHDYDQRTTTDDRNYNYNYYSTTSWDWDNYADRDHHHRRDDSSGYRRHNDRQEDDDYAYHRRGHDDSHWAGRDHYESRSGREENEEEDYSYYEEDSHGQYGKGKGSNSKGKGKAPRHSDEWESRRRWVNERDQRRMMRNEKLRSAREKCGHALVHYSKSSLNSILRYDASTMRDRGNWVLRTHLRPLKERNRLPTIDELKLIASENLKNGEPRYEVFVEGDDLKSNSRNGGGSRRHEGPIEPLCWIRAVHKVSVGRERRGRGRRGSRRHDRDRYREDEQDDEGGGETNTDFLRYTVPDFDFFAARGYRCWHQPVATPSTTASSPPVSPSRGVAADEEQHHRTSSSSSIAGRAAGRNAQREQQGRQRDEDQQPDAYTSYCYTRTSTTMNSRGPPARGDADDSAPSSEWEIERNTSSKCKDFTRERGAKKVLRSKGKKTKNRDNGRESSSRNRTATDSTSSKKKHSPEQSRKKNNEKSMTGSRAAAARVVADRATSCPESEEEEQDEKLPVEMVEKRDDRGLEFFVAVGEWSRVFGTPERKKRNLRILQKLICCTEDPEEIAHVSPDVVDDTGLQKDQVKEDGLESAPAAQTETVYHADKKQDKERLLPPEDENEKTSSVVVDLAIPAQTSSSSSSSSKVTQMIPSPSSSVTDEGVKSSSLSIEAIFKAKPDSKIQFRTPVHFKEVSGGVEALEREQASWALEEDGAVLLGTKKDEKMKKTTTSTTPGGPRGVVTEVDMIPTASEVNKKTLAIFFMDQDLYDENECPPPLPYSYKKSKLLPIPSTFYCQHMRKDQTDEEAGEPHEAGRKKMNDHLGASIKGTTKKTRSDSPARTQDNSTKQDRANDEKKNKRDPSVPRKSKDQADCTGAPRGRWWHLIDRELLSPPKEAVNRYRATFLDPASARTLFFEHVS